MWYKLKNYFLKLNIKIFLEKYIMNVFLVRSEGIEPPTLGAENRCSNPLSYERMLLYI